MAKNWGENKENSEHSPTQVTRALLPRFSLNQRVPGVAPFSLWFCQSRFNDTIWNFFKSIKYKLKGHWPFEITEKPSVHSNCLNIEVHVSFRYDENEKELCISRGAGIPWLRGGHSLIEGRAFLDWALESQKRLQKQVRVVLYFIILETWLHFAKWQNRPFSKALKAFSKGKKWPILALIFKMRKTYEKRLRSWLSEY